MIFIFGLAGLGLSYKRKYKFTGFYVLSMIIPLLFLLGTSRSKTHYTLLFPFLSLFAAETIYFIREKVKLKLKK